jgi:hypothetical protein
MEKKNYFNFLAMRKAMYDGKLSERARLVYIHLLQKSSLKGCAENALYNDVELTKELIAIDLGILTKTGEPSIKLIQRALEELEEYGYIKRFQKYKTKGCPLTIRLNLSQQFLRQNETQIDESENKNDSGFDKSESENVHHYNPIIIPSNLLQSNTNLFLSEKIEDVKTFEEVLEYFKNGIENSKKTEELETLLGYVTEKMKELPQTSDWKERFKPLADLYKEKRQELEIYKIACGVEQ